ncbi:unnamed protein product, partial [Meganyctiphanes norvegica]
MGEVTALVINTECCLPDSSTLYPSNLVLGLTSRETADLAKKRHAAPMMHNESLHQRTQMRYFNVNGPKFLPTLRVPSIHRGHVTRWKMVTAVEVINRLKGEGWCLSQEAVEELIEECNNGGGGTLSMHQVQQEILNSDIKDIGVPCLPSEIHKANNFNGPLVVQVSKVRNFSAPKAFQESGGAPRMLGVTFTDGTNYCTGIEIQNIKAISLKLVPGTKVKLTGKINVNNGYLILTPNNISVIGGTVEELYNKWKIATIKYAVRSLNLDGSGPPPWVAFGKHINKNYEELNKFKALKDPQVKKEEEDEFESQRKQTVQELAKEGTNKVFGGGKQMVDANLQKVVNAGFNPDVASWALKNNKNNPAKAIQELRAAQNPSQNASRDEEEPSSYGRGGRGRGRGRGRNKVEGPDGSDDEFPAANMPRPSGPASLFDFLDTKMISKNEKVKFVEPVPDVTGQNGRSRDERGRGRGGRGNPRDRARYNNDKSTNSTPPPNLLTESWPAPGEDLGVTPSNRGYFESKELMEDLENQEHNPRKTYPKNRQQYDHPSRNTGSAGRDPPSDFRNKSNAGSYESNYDGVQNNHYQNATQISSYANQKDSYRNGGGRGQRTFHNTYRNSGGRGQMNNHTSNEKDLSRSSGSQRGGYNSGQWNDYSSGYRDNYNNDQKDSYNSSPRGGNAGAYKGQNYNGGGKYVEKSYSQHSENAGRGGGNSHQQRGGSGNGGYGNQQYYQYSSDKYSNYSAEPSHYNSQSHNSNMYSDSRGYNNSKSAGGDYSSPRFNQSRGAAHAGGNASSGVRIEKEKDLIQQFQQSMLLQGHYNSEDVNAINARRGRGRGRG